MTKIDIYSGFLGAGKTTLIRKMIREAYGTQKIVLIENEFGEIGIDAGFLAEAGVQITEMNSGCICCSLVGDFGKALTQVIADYHPDRILIEPSGVGKLSDVIAAVRKVTSDDVQLGNFVAVADASKCKLYMKNFGEFYNNQIETANTIILSHTDKVSQEKLDACVALIRAHNAAAVLVTTPWNQLTGAQLMEAMEQRSSIALELAALEDAAHHHHEHDQHEHEHDESCSCGCHHHHEEEYTHEHHHDACGCHHDHDEHDAHEHHHHHDSCSCHHDHDEHEHHHHHDGECDDPNCACHHHHGHDADEVFTSWGAETSRKFTRAELEAILADLQDTERYGFVLRAKGYVPCADNAQWLHFDYVPGEPDIRFGSAMVTGRLCVIGSKLDEAAIAARLGA